MDSNLVKAADEVINFKMKAVDSLIEELVEPLEKIGNPEKLIDKPYELWTPQDLQSLYQIYGMGNDTPLTKLVVKKSLEKIDQRKVL